LPHLIGHSRTGSYWDDSLASHVLPKTKVLVRTVPARKQQPLVTGFKSTVDLPYRCLQIYAKRKYPNIEDLTCFIVPLLSRTKGLVFWTNCSYEQVGWDDKKIASAVWSNRELFLKKPDEVVKTVDDITSQFQSFIKSRLS